MWVFSGSHNDQVHSLLLSNYPHNTVQHMYISSLQQFYNVLLSTFSTRENGDNVKY